jgi:hypothetical protein
MSCLMISVQLRIVGNSCHLPGIVGDVPALGQVEEDEGIAERPGDDRGAGGPANHALFSGRLAWG